MHAGFSALAARWVGKVVNQQGNTHLMAGVAAFSCSCVAAGLASQAIPEYFITSISPNKNAACEGSMPQKPVKLQTRMTSIGHFSMISETKTNPSVITFLLRLSGDKMTKKEFVDLWKRSEISSKHPRFHHTVSNFPGYFNVNEDANIENHVTETTVPREKDIRDKDLINRLKHLQFNTWDLANELFHVWIANSLESTYLIFRSHHVLGDGASMAAALMDLSDEAEEFRKSISDFLAHRKRHRKTLWKRVIELLKTCFWFVGGSLQALLHHLALHAQVLLQGSGPWDALKRTAGSENQQKRVFVVAEAARVDQAKKVAKVLVGPGATVNDVFCSCIASATARLMHEQQNKLRAIGKTLKPLPPQMIMAMPVHLKGGVILPGESVGNNLGAFSILTSTSISDPTERLRQIHKNLSYVKSTPLAFLSHGIARCVSMASSVLPASFSGWLFENSHGGASIVVTNTRGPVKAIHFGGRKVENLFGFIPLPPGIPIGVVVCSYQGGIQLTLTAESWAVSDGDMFMTWILEEYMELVRRANALEKKQ